MKVVGEATARGSAEMVWGALHDAALLAGAIPGCEHFEVCGPGLGEFTASTALVAIRGTYAGQLTITEQQRPSVLRLTVSATGDQGTIDADVALRLSEAAVDPPGGADSATTLVSYEANGTVTGSIAGVGTRLLAGAAKRLAGEFFAVIDESVAARAAPSSADAPAVRPAAVASAAAEPMPRTRSLADGAGKHERAALVAGAAIGLAGIIFGVLAGRRGHRAGRVRA